MTRVIKRTSVRLSDVTPRKAETSSTLRLPNGNDNPTTPSIRRSSRVQQAPSRVLVESTTSTPAKKNKVGRPKKLDVKKLEEVYEGTSSNCSFSSSSDNEVDFVDLRDQDESEAEEYVPKRRIQSVKTSKAKKITKVATKTVATKAKPSTKRKLKQATVDRMTRVKQLLKESESIGALPGREEEFDWISKQVTSLLTSKLGGCLYISGVPGTGKTASTMRVIDHLTGEMLRKRVPEFDFVEINGMRLNEPAQAYSLLAQTVLPNSTGSLNAGATALKKLEAYYSNKKEVKRPCIVLLDELDLLLSRRKQSILYHFFEWPNVAGTNLIVVTIANTMDLPERFLSNRISSRLGLSRYNFKPYTYPQLVEIIKNQLKDQVKYLQPFAIELCARKVSAVSGDARRAVNLAKRAVDCLRTQLFSKDKNDQVMQQVDVALMDKIIRDALTANPIQVIQNCSAHQRVFLLAMLLYRRRASNEPAIKPPTLSQLYSQHFQLCRTHQFDLPALQQLNHLVESLEALKLIRVVRFREMGPDALVQILIHEEDLKKALIEDEALRRHL